MVYIKTELFFLIIIVWVALVTLLIIVSRKRQKSTDGVCGDIYISALIILHCGLINNKEKAKELYHKLLKGYEIIGYRFEHEQQIKIENITSAINSIYGENR